MKRHGDLFARLGSFKSRLGVGNASSRTSLASTLMWNRCCSRFDRNELLTQTFGPVPTAPSPSANRRWLTESSSSWMSMS